MHVVLVEPEIPQNTGTTARLCAATNTTLHLVGRLGFSLDEKKVRRAGLDYWPLVKLITYESIEEFKEKNKDGAKKLLSQAYSAIDKAAKRGVIKKNTASRRKASLSKATK